ncbi:MAG: alpha-L-fucosidase C-terminal domain-containing protein, partial [Candidatus Sulfotelmatobacter sp.]
GDAIYGTRAWKIYGEGPTKVTEGAFHDTDTQPYTAEDFRFTKKGDVLYAIELGWPSHREAVIHSLGSGATDHPRIAAVALLGSDAKLAFDQRDDGLHIHLPEQNPGRYAYSFRIQFCEIKLCAIN